MSSDEARYLIRKGGAYYRPNAQGYTYVKAEAGRYTLDQAISHSHPNGPDGPRDGITYDLDDSPPLDLAGEAKPDAWMYTQPDRRFGIMYRHVSGRKLTAKEAVGFTETPLYAHPPAAEPVGLREDNLRVALSAIKVIAATVKTPDVPKQLGRIMAIARWAGIEAQYHELQKDERVALQLSDAPADVRRAALTTPARTEAVRERETLELLEAMLRPFAGQPDQCGDAYKIIDATLSPRGEEAGKEIVGADIDPPADELHEQRLRDQRRPQ